MGEALTGPSNRRRQIISPFSIEAQVSTLALLTTNNRLPVTDGLPVPGASLLFFHFNAVACFAWVR